MKILALATAIGFFHITPPIQGHYDIAIGLNAGENLTLGSDDILIGANAGRSLTTGNRVLIIGNGIDVPTPDTSDYVNIENAIVLHGLQARKFEEVFTPDIRKKVRDALTSAAVAP